MGLIIHSFLFKYFSQQGRDRRLFWHKVLQAFKFLDCFIIFFKFYKSVCFLEAVQSIFRIKLFRLFKLLKSLREFSFCSQSHPHKRIEDRIFRIYLYCSLEKLAGSIILLLFVGNVSLSPPSTVMPYIKIDRMLKHFFCFGEVFIINMLMSTKRVCIRVIWIKLNCSVKKINCLVMLFLK